MASASSVNDTGANGENLSFAEKLQKKHEESHNPTVEEVEDEEDKPHPPSSSVPANTTSTAETEEAPLSEKAKGKQKVEEAPAGQANQGKQAVPQPFDTTSEELFPALGSGPKPRAADPVPAAWGSKKPASVARKANGVNGDGTGSSGPTSRTSTPVSGPLSPSTNSQPRMQMPGRHSETVHFTPSQLLARNQLKKPIPDVLRDINKKSKARVEMKHGKDGGIAFESIGPSVDTVQQALREIAKQVGAKQSVKIPVPASARPYIIGRQGATITNIIQESGAYVQVPKADDSVQGLDEDDDHTIDVVVEGDPIAAEIARRKIEAIVKERTSTMSTRLREIPAELYPFLAGPFDSGLEPFTQGGEVQVKVPAYHSWSRQGPPKINEQTQAPILAPHPSSHIQLVGDREAVQRARADIEHQAEALQGQLMTKQLPIDRNRHQFILGDRDSHNNFLKDTGCYVILPHDDDDTEMVTLVGPQDRLDLGEASVVDLAMSMQQQLIDIARVHNNAPQGAQAHARAITNYLKQREALAELEQLYNSRIVLPPSGAPMNWDVFSRDGPTGYRVKSDITNIINAHPPSRFRHVELNPFYHQHLRDDYRDQLRQQHGVHLVIPDDENDSEVVIVYEGVSEPQTPFELPRQRPSQADAVRFEEALRQAEQIIQNLSAGQRPIESRPVEVPQKFHDKVHRHVSQEQRNLSEGVFPIQFIPPADPSEAPIIRGPNDRLDPFAEVIRAFVEAEKQDELERDHMTSFDFPKRHANFLIGKRGENINKLREEFDVDIHLGEGKVDIKGPPNKAEKAKSRILAMSKKLDDEATHVLKIQPQYHREMIGARGSQVNRLQERYNVRVQFPRSASNQDDDGSVVNGSEAGGHRNARSNQAPDEVVIRGPKKGADAAKEELESLLKYTVENSHSGTVSVAQGQLPSLIGTGGREMENIRQQTGAKIDVPGARDGVSPSGRVEIKLKGTRKQVEDAKTLLQGRAKVFDDSTTKVIDVDKKHHRAIIGPSGTTLKGIVAAAGGPTHGQEHNRIVKVPRPDSGETAIRLEGNKAVIDKIAAEIQKIVAERENQVSDTVEVPTEKHRHLIGPGGETRRKLEAELGVTIEIPRESVQGPQRSQIKLSGPADKIVPAKERLSGMFKDVEGETIEVPRSLHHVISDNGHFFVKLRRELNVTVDHGGQQPPPKPLANQSGKSDTPLPLITDEGTGEEGYKWDLVDKSAASSDEEGTIPWILRGPSPEALSKAKMQLEAALERAKVSSCTGYLVLPDPSSYRLVIGQGGERINGVRAETGCRIDVPNKKGGRNAKAGEGDGGEAIVVNGSKEGVERAKELILEAVKGRY